MENDILNKLWAKQMPSKTELKASDIMLQAKQQRNRQFIGVLVMTLTMLVWTFYMFNFAFPSWNSFNLGLVMIVTSLCFRIILELFSFYRKEKKLIAMDQKSYLEYLKNYYRIRKYIHFGVTPCCVLAYLIGFYLLLPYFKNYFSIEFYWYILISGIISLSVVIIIIIKSIVKELNYLNTLQRQ